MEKIRVKLCCGTLCYVMGGAELQSLPDRLSENLKTQVAFSSSTCLDYCNKYPTENPPFVDINGEYIAEATPNKVIAKINQLIENK